MSEPTYIPVLIKQEINALHDKIIGLQRNQLRWQYIEEKLNELTAKYPLDTMETLPEPSLSSYPTTRDWYIAREAVKLAQLRPNHHVSNLMGGTEMAKVFKDAPL